MPSVEVLPRASVPLAPLTTLGVGGPARSFTDLESIEAVAGAHRWARTHGVPLVILAGGSNLVIADEGVDGLVGRVALRGVTFRRAGADTIVHAAAGEPWDAFVEMTVARGLAGLECLSGIPGTVGGTPIQNVGAYGQEVAAAIESVTVYDTGVESMVTLDAAECGFAYRMSRFKRDDAGRFIVCGVTFRLTDRLAPPAYADLRAELDRLGMAAPSTPQVRDAVLAVRRRKGMVVDAADPDTRSVGSFFMNPVLDAADLERLASIAGGSAPSFGADASRRKVPAAWLIERSGFQRGFADGAAGISSKHTLAIINRGGATARDVLRLAVRVKRAVADRFGVSLRPEPVFVGFDGDRDVEFLRT